MLIKWQSTETVDPNHEFSISLGDSPYSPSGEYRFDVSGKSSVYGVNAHVCTNINEEAARKLIHALAARFDITL